MTKPVDFHGDFAALDEDARDDIINPKHYELITPGTYPDGLEYFDIMELVLERHNGVVGHALGQVFKYAFRLGAKDDILQDAKKIEWYASRLVQILEKQNEEM